MSLSHDTDQERANPADILAVLMKTTRPLSISAIADNAHIDAMPVARTLGDLVRSGDVKRLTHLQGAFFWLATRTLPADCPYSSDTPGNPRTVSLMSQHDDPEDAAAPPTAPTPKAVIPTKVGIQVAQPTTGATMPTKKDKPLSSALADALEQLAKHPNGIKPRELGRLMSIDSSVISQRLAKLKARGLAKAIGWNWHATSPAAPLEAKMPETPRQQTTLKAPRKPSLETLDATLRNKNKRRTAGPAIIDGINTRDFLEPPRDDDDTPNEAVALTDKQELLILSSNRVEQIIKSATALRLVAFLRTLPSDHALALQA